MNIWTIEYALLGKSRWTRWIYHVPQRYLLVVRHTGWVNPLHQQEFWTWRVSSSFILLPDLDGRHSWSPATCSQVLVELWTQPHLIGSSNAVHFPFNSGMMISTAQFFRGGGEGICSEATQVSAFEWQAEREETVHREEGCQGLLAKPNHLVQPSIRT